MVKTRLIFLLFLMVLIDFDVNAGTNAYSRLDSLIGIHGNLIQAKTARIESIKAALNPKGGVRLAVEKEYEICSMLCNEYAEFKNDSALSYARRNIELANVMHDNSKLIDSRLNLMHFLTKAYLLDETEQMASEIDTTVMNTSQLQYYYKILSDIYLFKVEFHNGSDFEKVYQEQLTKYRKKVAELAKPGSERQQLYHAGYLNDTGHTQEAIALLEQMLRGYKSGDRTYSVITSTLAFYYGNKGDQEKQKQLLAMSAASDIEGCIMENTALRQLADILFDEGDIDRAYKYINLSVADATFYGTRLRNVQASQLVPRIINAYQAKQEKNYRNLRNMIMALSVLALLLVAGVIALGMLYKRYRRLSESRKTINDALNDTVSQLRERDKIKEQYLGRFLTLSSTLIEKNESRRKVLNRLAMEDKNKELKLQLKSPNFYYENTKLFYENFDSAFLNIYPNFINEVNRLLQDGEAIEIKGEEQLTRELRILALIRLGITENKEIASILRSSIATVYTYRSRLKARARDKDAFEMAVKLIQSES